MPAGKLWDPWKMYDATPEELKAVRERAKLRQSLKAEWIKKSTDPWKGRESGGFLFDPAVQRFIALKATQAERFKGSFKSAAMACLMFVVPVGLLYYSAVKNKADKERKYRNGEVMYKDRVDRFFN
ncbi:hypothetical protein Btru_022314 [Bulinus truncatus]|nr:hypothetical protein Btru_022314 [Bulinus truncatus]